MGNNITAISRKSTFLFALPGILMGLSQTLMSSFDYIFTGHLGADVSAAIAPAATIVFTFVSFWLGGLSIFSTLPAKAKLSNDAKDFSHYLFSGLFMAATSAPISIGLFFAAPFIVGFFGHPMGVQVQEINYLSTMAFTLPAAAMAFLFQNLFTLSGDTKTPSIIVIGGHLINLCLNYVFVIALEKGVSGAALATVLATAFQAILMGIVFYKNHKDLLDFKIDSALLKKKLIDCYKKALPSGAQWTQTSLVMMLFTNIFIGELGMVMMAAHNLLMQVGKLASLPVLGIANTSSSLIAKALGVEDGDSAKTLLRHVFELGVIIISISCLFLLVFGKAIFLQFSSDLMVVQMSLSMLPFLFAYICAFGLEASVHSWFRGKNDTLTPAFASALSQWGVLIGGSYLALTFFPETGIKGLWTVSILCPLAGSLIAIARESFRYRPGIRKALSS